MIGWILTFVNESCRTGSEITLRELSHTSVRQEEFSQLSEVTWKKSKPTTKKTRINDRLSGFNYLKPNKCYFTIAYYITHSISLLLIKHDYFIMILQKFQNKDNVRWIDGMIA